MFTFQSNISTMTKYLTLLIALCLIYTNSDAQVYSNKEAGKKRQHIADSLKTAEYPYILPIWGDKATKAGFSLPYSAGLSVNYLWQQSDILINNLQVGFNNGPMHNIDEYVQFNDAIARSNAVNIRPDFWLFPFLNVYGIFAQSKTSTEVDIDIRIPTDEGFTTITTLNTIAEFNGTSVGFGLTPTLGIGGGWLALDMNFTWTDIDALDKPAFGFVFGPRIGKSFQLKKPEQNIAIWTGGFRFHIDSGTSGSLPLNSLWDSSEANDRVAEAQTNLDLAAIQVDTWWTSLTEQEQNLPSNKAKYNAATQALDVMGAVVDGAGRAVEQIDNSTVQYSLDKRQKNLWNLLAGAQWQINKHWMIRAEAGFLAARTQFLGGIQYRFGL